MTTDLDELTMSPIVAPNQRQTSANDDREGAGNG